MSRLSSNDVWEIAQTFSRIPRGRPDTEERISAVLERLKTGTIEEQRLAVARMCEYLEDVHAAVFIRILEKEVSP